MDFNIQKVRTLRIFLRTVEGCIFLFLISYIMFLSYCILLNVYGVDFQFVIYFWLILFLEVLRVNGLFKCVSVYETHWRYPSETEKNIVNSFFKKRKLEIREFYVQDNPDCYNAFVGNYRGSIILVINERVFRSCSLREIWAILAHEIGHVKNGDITGEDMISLCDTREWLLYLSFWFSVLAILKIFWGLLFFPEELLFSPDMCLFICSGIIFFLGFLKNFCGGWFYHATQILADNTGAQILGSAMWMLECLQMLDSRIYFPGFALREKALLWILKDETLRL